MTKVTEHVTIFTVIYWRGYFTVDTLLWRNLFCRVLRTFVRRKIKPKIVFVEEKKTYGSGFPLISSLVNQINLSSITEQTLPSMESDLPLGENKQINNGSANNGKQQRGEDETNNHLKAQMDENKEELQSTHDKSILKIQIKELIKELIESKGEKNSSIAKANKCYQCDFASSYAWNLRTHLKTHSGEKSNKCNQCDYVSSEAGDLRTHLKTHSGEMSKKCK